MRETGSWVALLALAACAGAPIEPSAAPGWRPPAAAPGAVETTDAALVCGRDAEGRTYSQSHRHVTAATKRLIAARDGYQADKATEIEIDHRVPKCLGGADDPANLMAQPWEGPCGAEAKDRLETALCRAVCISRSLSLAEAQAVFLGPYWTRLPGCAAR